MDEAKKLQAEMPAGTFVIGSNMDFGKCEVCGSRNEELRPYGKNGANICYTCGMKDKAETERNMRKAMGL
jgi:hypothetical protein